ncbi:AAA family ATPase [Planctomycetales bacterium ZRK34]|nr:AAA family ATPase [Planctomycetales bacterium ZRK34]
MSTGSSEAIDRLRHDRSALEAEIVDAGSTIRGDACNCPSPDHPDRHPSAMIYTGEDGAWRVKCHACGWCGDVFDIRAMMTGRPLADVLREARGADRPRTARRATPADMLALAKRYHEVADDDRLVALAKRLSVSVDSLRRLRVGWCERDGAYSFPMRNAAGDVTGIRLRLDDAKYAERGGRDGLFIPVGLIGSGPLLIAEGPTDCAAALDMGYDAIGRANNSARTTDDLIAEYVTRQRRDEVWIVTDADPAGSRAAEATQAAADRLAARLVPVVGTVRVFAPPSPHKDVRAWRINGATADDVDAAAEASSSRGPAGELRDMLAAEIDGRRSAIAWPWRLVTRGTQALIPGTVTLIVGDPGSGKSLLVMQALAHWHDAGVKVAAFELEQSRAEHLKRALAQRIGAAWLTDLEAVAQRGDEAMAYNAEHEAWIDALGRCIHDGPAEPVKLCDLIGWTEARAAAGARIIVIDPITAAQTTDRPWDDAQRFLQTVMPILDHYGASLVLVSHPRKGKQRGAISTLDDLAGGAAWQRFAQCILWLERHDEPRDVTVKGFAGLLHATSNESINRTLRVMKARNGRGAGWQLAFDFDPETLRFHERGAIVKSTTTRNAELDG